MKIIKILALIFVITETCLAQTDPQVYKTMSFFYIDNSSGGNAPGLNQEVINFLKLKMDEQEKQSGNYVSAFTVDSANSTLFDNVTKTVSFDHLSKYLSKSSASASYSLDNEALNVSFKQSPVNVSGELTVYLFLSSKAINKMITQADDMPTPLIFPDQLATYVMYEKPLKPSVYLITNKDVLTKYTEAQILRCFTLYIDKNSVVNPMPTIMFK